MSTRSRVRSAAGRAQDWLTRRRDTSVPVDLSVELFERDRDAFASVLGSAIALRLFLFMLPAVMVIVGLVGVITGTAGIRRMVDVSGVGGAIATQLSDAARTAHRTSWALLVIGLALSFWAGRSLTRVLAACSAGAWRLSGRETKLSLRTMTTVTGLLMVLVVATALLNQVRRVSGIAVTTAGLVAAAAVLGAGWFFVTWSLPRRTRDPGALLPGAALVGAAMGVLQWFMQFYLPGRISRSSEVMGSLGLSVAVLGYLFLVGRLMSASFVLDAVLWERFGSASALVFTLPGLRSLARRSAFIRRTFDLDRTETGGAASTTPKASLPEGTQATDKRLDHRP